MLLRKALLLLGFMIFISCGDENSPTNSVVSEDRMIPFSQILMRLEVKTGDSSYLVMDKLDSVKLLVNGQRWSTSSTEVLDTSKIAKSLRNNFFVSSQPLNYMLIAPYEADDTEAFSTAGEYADYLNLLQSLRPGEYACFWESFSIRGKDGSVNTYYPQQYQTFSVEEGHSSAFAGTLTYKLNL